ILKQTGIFASVDDAVCNEVCNLVQARHYAKDEFLFNQGEPGREMFIVASGRVKVFIGEEGDERVLALLGDGESFGEMALLTGEPRSASAIALADSRLLVLPKEAFDRFIAGNAAAMLEIARVMARRQALTNAQLLSKPDELALDVGGGAQVLTIQIDQDEVEEAVEEICAMDFFEELELKAAQLRRNVHGA